MQRAIEQALNATGEASAAATWRAVCRVLSGPLFAAVAARRIDAADRLSRKLEADGTRTAVVGLADGSDLGFEEPVLACHVLIFPTPFTGALGAEERAAIERLTPLAPSSRAVVLTGEELLARVSDTPEKEAADVRTRVRALLPEDWALLDEDELPGWLKARQDELVDLASARRTEVASFLMADVRTRTTAAMATMKEDLAKVDALLADEDEQLASVQKHGDRIASHMLSAMRNETEQLLIDLRAFLVQLEKDLPAELESIPDVSVVRHTLPHWLNHVVEQWVSARLAEWRLAVLTDLEGLRLEDSEADHADLLAPALYAAPLRDDSGWTRRLVVSAAVGGGAAMFLVGLWIPAAIAMTGGVLWQTLSGRGSDAATRERLAERAIAALRAMGRDAERLLREQLDQIGAELENLGNERATALGSSRADLRAELEERGSWQRSRLADKQRISDDLATKIGDILG